MRFEEILLYILVYIVAVCANMIQSLTQEERGELARKFKYYHASVRPGDKFNLVETINGTFFHLNTEIELLQSRPTYEQLYLEMVMIIHYHDDRLVMRELSDVLSIPNEFTPWLPTLEPSPFVPVHRSIHVDPKTGQLTVFVRIQSMISCYTEAWKSPFERFTCNLGFSTEQDERIFIRSNRDLRPDSQIRYVQYTFDEWPYMVFYFDYDTHWHSAVVNSYLPSILIFSVVVFAQWKRRKIQIMVTIAAMVSIVFMQTTQRRYNTITMQDLWMSAILIHLIAILTVDLLLPSRRIVHTTIEANGSDIRRKGSYEDSDSSRHYRHYAQPHENTPLMTAYSSSQLDIPRQATLVAAGSEVRLIRSPSMAGFSVRQPIRRQITEMTIGKKKRIALMAILICYAIFFFVYCGGGSGRGSGRGSGGRGGYGSSRGGYGSTRGGYGRGYGRSYGRTYDHSGGGSGEYYRGGSRSYYGNSYYNNYYGNSYGYNNYYSGSYGCNLWNWYYCYGYYG